MGIEIYYGWNVENLHSFCSNRSFILEALEMCGPPNRPKSIYIQDEHTLVLPGGRDIPLMSTMGSIKSRDKSCNYMVRLCSYEKAIQSDYIIDYAVPNVINLRNSRFGSKLHSKVLYAPSIPSTFYAPTSMVERSHELITNYNDPFQSRRSLFVSHLKNLNLPVRNITGTIGEQANLQLYADTKILINVHQTDHHHTVEEFRILPALSQGCIVISEWCPLICSLPYAPFIIWSDYDELPLKVNDVIKRYHYYYHKIHADGSLRSYLSWYRQSALQILARKLQRGI